MENYTNKIIIFWAEYLFIFIIIISGIFFILQDKNKKKEMIIFWLFSLPIIYITAKTSSLFFYNPRPFFVWNFIPLIPHIADNWFPSDHTLISSAVSMINFVFNKKIWIILMIISFFVWTSRVLAWVHHFIDIIWSMIISIIITLIIEKFIYKKYVTKYLNNN